MTVSRSTPTRASSTDRIGEKTYADRVNEEVSKLWEFSASPLTTIGGTANAITAQANGATVTALAVGMGFVFVPAATNTGAVTLAVDGTSATAVKDEDGNALTGGEIASGRLTRVWFDGTQYRLRRIPHITISASAPSGGVDGDIWLQTS